MIFGAHILVYSRDPEADRAFFRDVLRFPAVDIGRGWLIFALPPSEVAVHPVEGEAAQAPPDRLLRADLYLMCDDVYGMVESLKTRNVRCTEIVEEPWGVRTTIELPSGGEIGLYQPKHPTALGLTPS